MPSRFTYYFVRVSSRTRTTPRRLRKRI